MKILGVSVAAVTTSESEYMGSSSFSSGGGASGGTSLLMQSALVWALPLLYPIVIIDWNSCSLRDHRLSLADFNFGQDSRCVSGL